jgi:phosphoglycolate phosphatase
MPVEALIFDLDGTLVDTAPDLLLATNHALSLIERTPVTMEQLRTYVGHGAMNLIERGALASGSAVDPGTLKMLHSAFLDYYGDNIAFSSMIFEGLEELIEQASLSGLKLGVCTNKIERFSIKLLTELGIMTHFSAVVGGDTMPVMKPDPVPYVEVARRLGVDVQDTLMIGDSETDIRTAQNAGVPVIAVTFGYTAKPVASFNPTHVISHYDEAWPIIERYL